MECVVNVSEGRRLDVLGALVNAVETDLLDLHTDPDHNRSVFTLVGEDAPRRLTERAIALLDLAQHDGVHPRIGVVDVVPFVPLGDATLADATRARDEFARWAAEDLGVPVFLYGPERSLPLIRKGAFQLIQPDVGPPTPHRTAGAVCVGAREPLVAYNLFVSDVTIDEARAIAASVRSDTVRALALTLGSKIQVSMNLVKPDVTTPFDAFNRVSAHAHVTQAELVGLLPADVLAAIPRDKWDQLDVGIERTIEFRLAKWAQQSL